MTATYGPTNFTTQDAASYKAQIDANFAALSPGNGFVNKFRNGNFDVAQRGASGTVTTGNTKYTLDGWMVGATGATISWSQIFGSISPYSGSFLLLQGANSMTDTFVKQRIESTFAASLTGKQVTVQWLVNTSASTGTLSPTITVKHPTAQDNWASTTTDVSAVSLQAVPAGGASALLSYTFAAAALAINGLEITLDFGSFLNSSSQVTYIAGADIRATPGVATGLNANPPANEIRSISAELPFCQRYLPAFGAVAEWLALGQGSSSTTAVFLLKHPVTTRALTTALSLATPGDFNIYSAQGAFVGAVTGIAFATGGETGTVVVATVASGLTVGTMYALVAVTGLAGNLIFTGAEL